jgi:hypothetical protein
MIGGGPDQGNELVSRPSVPFGIGLSVDEPMTGDR